MFKRILPRTLALILSAMFFVTLFCPFFAVNADEQTFRITEGNIVIGADGAGLYVSVGEKRTTLDADTQIIIDGRTTTTTNTIRIRDNISANVTLKNTRIEPKELLKAPLEICDAANVTLTLSGANTLSAGRFMAGIQVARYAKLSILGDGSLSAKGGEAAAGIGGGWTDGISGASCGEINIGGEVSVHAVGGDCGAGIGGGEGGSTSAITVTDHANIQARGGKHAAGIGGGSASRCGQIKITSHATAEVIGGEGAAAIGSGYSGSTEKITVSGTASVRVSGGEGGAGIGSGKKGHATMVTIANNATVRARGGEGGAGIGAGADSSLSVGISIYDTATVFSIGGSGGAGIGGANGSIGNLSFAGTIKVDAIGGNGAAGIGSGKGGSVLFISIDSDARNPITAYGGLGAAGIGAGDSGKYEKIELCGNSAIHALGGKFGAGIGGGRNAVCGEMHIYGKSDILAQGGNFGAGIGTGSKELPDYAPSAGNIYIYETATVRAAGGQDAAGIGGGRNAAGGRVVIADTATVSAYANILVTAGGKTPEGGADYSAVHAAIANIPADYKEKYTDDSVRYLDSVVASVIEDLPKSQQATVDQYALDIQKAISLLVPKPITYALSASSESYVYGDEIKISWTGVEQPNFSIILLKKGASLGQTEKDESWNVPLGNAILTYKCTSAESEILSEGTVTLSLPDGHFLRSLFYTALPAGDYTAHLCSVNESGAPTSLATVSFTVTEKAGLADYTALRAACLRMQALNPADYAEEDWKELTDLLTTVSADLPETQNDTIKACADALNALLDALKPKNDPEAQAGSTGTTVETVSARNARVLYPVTLEAQTNPPRIVLLAASPAPDTFAWGQIPAQNENTEPQTENAMIAPINHVITPSEINANEEDGAAASSLPAANIGAGAGCSMSGSLSVSDGANFNGSVPDVTVRLEYGASIGTLHFAHFQGDTFILPESITCPGYVFKGWFTDENYENNASGSLTLTTDLTFYAKWEIIPVSIDSTFKFASGILGELYSDTIRLKEENTHFTASIIAGDLPKGLSLDALTGTISGIPSETGTSTFTLRISDANGTTTDAEYSITIFRTVEMTFTFYTASNEQAGTNGEIFFHYSYYDRGSGALRKSDPINLTELLKDKSDALQPGSVDTITLTVGGFVGEPDTLYFENTVDDDGWRIEKVVISSPGGEQMSAFEKTYPINAWIGNVDEVSFFESGTFVICIILLVILLIIVGIILFLRLRNRRPPQDTSPEKEAQNGPPSAPEKPRHGKTLFSPPPITGKQIPKPITAKQAKTPSKPAQSAGTKPAIRHTQIARPAQKSAQRTMPAQNTGSKKPEQPNQKP